MSETLNPIMENLARQLAEAMIEDFRAAVEEIRAAPPVSPWLNEMQAAEYLGLKVRGMQNHRKQRTGPRYCKAGVVRYHLDDLDAFLQAGGVEAKS